MSIRSVMTPEIDIGFMAECQSLKATVIELKRVFGDGHDALMTAYALMQIPEMLHQPVMGVRVNGITGL